VSPPSRPPGERVHATVLGNALVDEIVTGEGRFAHPGGAGLNLGAGLATLGAQVTLVAAVAPDCAGRMLRATLDRYRIALAPQPGPEVTARAIIHLERAEPHYEFSQRAYLAFSFDRELGELVQGSAVTVVNAFNYESPAQVAGLRRLLLRAPGWRVIDPNLRPGLIVDPQLLARQIESLLQVTDILKVSDEDLGLLGGPGDRYSVDRLLRGGAAVVFLTKGARGAEVHTARGDHLAAPAGRCDAIVDTVGAGDSALSAFVMSALGESMGRGGDGGRRPPLAGLTWPVHLEAAMRAAAVSCGQRGGPARLPVAHPGCG